MRVTASRRPASKRSANNMALLLSGLFRLPSVGPHVLCPFQNMTFHRLAEILVACSSWKADLGVEREEPGVITMCAGRGTRAHVADFATIVSTLRTRTGYVLLLGNVGIKVGLFCRDIIENPVYRSL